MSIDSSSFTPAPEERTPGALWRWYALLTLPFVVCAAYLLATGRVFAVFWGSDEFLYTVPLMQSFARDLPHVNLRYSGPAMTPLLHLLGACLMRWFGADLQTLRMLNAAVSLGGVLVLFATLRGRRHHRAAMAALLAAVFLSSCYFFGYSFRLLTDNMAIVYCILALAQLYRFIEAGNNARLSTFLWSCLWLCLTLLTRQTYLFLGLVFVVTLLRSPLSVRRKLGGLAGLALATVPLAALFLVWHGLVPPDSQERHTSTLISLYAPALPLMLLGAYTPFFAGPRLYRRWTENRIDPRRWTLPAAAAVAGFGLVAAFPLFPLASQRDRATYISDRAWSDIPGYFAGWIYKFAGHLPVLHGNSLAFWLLLPCGLAAAVSAGRTLFGGGATPAARLAPLFLLSLLLSSFLNGVSSQKYYDALILLFLVLNQPAEPAAGRFQWIALAGLILLFCAYYLAYIYGVT